MSTIVSHILIVKSRVHCNMVLGKIHESFFRMFMQLHERSCRYLLRVQRWKDCFQIRKLVMADKRTRFVSKKLNRMLFRRKKNLYSLKQLNEKRRQSRKGKSIDKSLSDNEDELKD